MTAPVRTYNDRHSTDAVYVCILKASLNNQLKKNKGDAWCVHFRNGMIQGTGACAVRLAGRISVYRDEPYSFRVQSVSSTVDVLVVAAYDGAPRPA
jgi:hypothetical protein